ncbi:hypothetical protein RND71_014522 [Anisodus tanguticus]|uniref:Uncharacterized protein n=1 Tax=Anisodus tanguticus TaxID=243964 RepID=A0AAE1SBM8_9SOLA|nr:hypothetical protein RND71_014522 [Anisodus tanguticus]
MQAKKNNSSTTTSSRIWCDKGRVSENSTANHSVGSIEGRVGVHHLDDSQQSKKLHIQMPQGGKRNLLSQLPELPSYRNCGCASMSSRFHKKKEVNGSHGKR